MDYVGVEFKAGIYFVPEVLRSAKAMQESMNIIKPILAETSSEPTGKLIIGTVKGDLHDIGKTLVECIINAAGFEVIDLGIDLPPEKFVEAIKEHKAGRPYNRLNLAKSMNYSPNSSGFRMLIVSSGKYGLTKAMKRSKDD